MLILSRKKDQKIIIGEEIVITVVELDNKQVKLGIEAPKEVEIHREEVYRQIEAENRGAVLAAGFDLATLKKLAPDFEKKREEKGEN